MELFTVAAVLIWIICGVLAYGITFAHFQGMFPEIADKTRFSDQLLAAFMGMMGPIGLIVTLLLGKPFRSGLRYW